MDKKCELSCRRNKVGGQAVIEGVMMKKGEEVCLAMRKEDGSVEIDKSKFVSVRTKHKWLNIPLLRGVIGFIESMILSFKTINKSTAVLELDEDSSKKDGEKKSGGALNAFIMVISVLLGVALAIGLFMWLPGMLTKGIEYFTGELNRYLKAAIEGVVKIIIFIVYMLVVSLMKDIKRVFQYHGAEHKSIACYEAGMELTPENAKKCTRFHPRCGTSFMFVMLIIGIFTGMLIPVWDNTLLRAAIKLAILPVVVGIGYEFIMLAGKHDNIVTRIISAPGMWVQRITTKEPTLEMLEIAITSIKCALRDDFPEFMEFYNSRGWEKKAENTEETVEIADDATEAAEPAKAAIDGQTAEAEEVSEAATDGQTEAEELDGQTEPLTSEDNENGGIADTDSERAE